MRKCPYCQRHLRGGIRCTACRRYIFGWTHLLLLTLLISALTLGLLEILFRLI